MTAAIEFRGVQKTFGNTEVIRGVDLAIAKGEIHAVIGPNGAGKSTLFNLVTGRHHVSRGRIELNGEDITNRAPHDIYRKGLSRSFQVTNIFANMSVFENVRCGLLWNLGYRYSFWQFVNRRRDLRERAESVLEQTGLTSRRNMPAGLLSYSDQRALEIAVTIAGGAKVVLLDEPTSGMSGAETEQAVALIRDISAARTMIIVEHDMGVVFDLADRISVLVYGQVIATGTPKEIRANAKVQEAYLGTEAG
ncbi:MAG: ABC transporter ATP-binding protein [Proteobacteria bacterium]|nr:ABC transporter ATP-binding protein [Pseudomonadota bacterium]MDA1357803.1 ABC transporter ATP-binding protein [Pseudomonadota bacterium]